MGLSKSQYVKGLQCPKILWLKKNKGDEAEVSAFSRRIMRIGTEVGDLAKGRFGDYVEIPFDRDDFPGMAERTSKLMAEGAPIICEATFVHEDNVCLVDILRVDAGGVDVIEVKASNSVKDCHYDDVAYQVWVLEHCGITVKSASLMHLNSGYLRDGELDLERLFDIEDITGEVRARIDDVPDNIEAIVEVKEGEDEPQVDPGDQCDDPYSCEFKEYCRVNCGACGPDVDGASGATIDGYRINRRFSGLRRPLCFVKFGTDMPGVPKYDGTHSWQNIPMQYALCLIDEDGDVTRKEFSAAGDSGDPRREIAEHLCADVPMSSSIISYNKRPICRILEDLAVCNDTLSDILLDMSQRVVSLSAPLWLNWYEHPALAEPYGIDDVCDVLLANNPAPGLKELAGIACDDDAMVAYDALARGEADDCEEVKAQLGLYCQRYTSVMAQIFREFLVCASS